MSIANFARPPCLRRGCLSESAHSQACLCVDTRRQAWRGRQVFGGHGGYPAVLIVSWAALTGQET